MTAPTTVGGTLAHIPGDLMPHGGQPAITVQDMLDRQKLITVDQAHALLSTTEPMASVSFETTDKVRFRVEENWNEGEEFVRKHGTEAVDVFVTFQDGQADATEYQLAKDAVFEATTTCGLGKGYVARCPGFLVQDQLNYWFRGGLEKSLQLMVLGEAQLGAAITRDSVQPFSNLHLMEAAIERIHALEPGLEVFVDANKINHSMRGTNLQLVIPGLGREILNTGETNDVWWAGLQLQNSQTAEGQTDVDAFLFRQLCTNGMIDVAASSGAWSRKSGGQDEAQMLEWARRAVDEVLGGLEPAFDRVQNMVNTPLNDEVRTTAADIFAQHRVPTRAQKRIMDLLVENDQLTLYGLTNAITASANGDVPASEQQLLMRAGGAVALHAERCDNCRRFLPEGVILHNDN